MKRLTALLMAAAICGPLSGCRDLAEEVLDEAGEVVRDQKTKVIDQAQDAAIEKLDEQREHAADAAAQAVSGGEEGGSVDASDTEL
jgi:hypothetical protein